MAKQRRQRPEERLLTSEELRKLTKKLGEPFWTQPDFSPPKKPAEYTTCISPACKNQVWHGTIGWVYKTNSYYCGRCKLWRGFVATVGVIIIILGIGGGMFLLSHLIRAMS